MATKKIGKGTLAIVVAIIILAIYAISSYNSMVTQDEAVRTAWSDVQTQYQRRSDLIPNLVSTVRGYASHESTTLEQVVAARSRATQLTADVDQLTPEKLQQLEAAQAAYDEGQTVLASLNAQYDDIISWADMYDTASIEAKKMIVNCLIKRVDVYRDYKLHIDFNIDFEQFSMGLDIVWIAA